MLLMAQFLVCRVIIGSYYWLLMVRWAATPSLHVILPLLMPRTHEPIVARFPVPYNASSKPSMPVTISISRLET